MKRLSSWLKQFAHWLIEPSYRGLKISLILFLLLTGAFFINRGIHFFQLLSHPGTQPFLQWARGDEAARAALITTQRDACPGAPFILPTDGFIGLLYEDPRGPYSSRSPHQGIDIFSEGDPGTMPVYAAYSGYVSREANWRSALILRIPDDPLRPGEQIWLYYSEPL